LKIGVLGQGRFGRGLANQLDSIPMEVTSWSRTPKLYPWKNRSFAQFSDMDLSEFDVLVIATGSANPAACSSSDELSRTLGLLASNRSTHNARIIYLSSGAVYGECMSPMKETQYPKPTTTYGRAKLSTENELRRTFGERLQVFRIGNIVPQNMDFGLFSAIKGSFANAIPITFFGDMNDCRDYLAEEELLQVLTKIIAQPSEEVLLNVGSGTALSLSEIASTVEEITSGVIGSLWANRKITDVAKTKLDCSKFQNLCNPTIQNPRIYLENQLTALWAELKVNG